MKHPKFEGSMVALVTPMLASGEIDYDSYKKLLEWHCQAATSAIVILGTTGESATITANERRELIEVAIAKVAGVKPVIVGTGTNATASTITNTQQAAQLGADGVLVVNPYYNRPTQAGLCAHIQQTADSSYLPVILYNHPGRTGCNLSIDSVRLLAEHPNIVAIKEAMADNQRYQQLAELNIDLLGGNDDDVINICQSGGVGVISVAANIIPDQMAELVRLSCEDKTVASELYNKIEMVINSLMVESNPIPVKFALQQMGKIALGIRLPLTELSIEHQEPLRRILKSEELI